jgi:long-subunit fatty acid transport protein
MMMKTVNRMVFAAAAASMALLPIAAQANTRAGDNGSVYSVSAPGLGRSAEGEAAVKGASIILLLFAGGLIIGGIVFASKSDDDGQSPGT